MNYNYKLIDLLKDYISTDFICETVEGNVRELRRYRKEFKNVPGYNVYRYGNIMPYYDQIRNYYNLHNIPCSDNNTVMQEHFEKHLERAIDYLLEEYQDLD